MEMLDGVEEDVELEVMIVGSDKGTMGATKLEQEQRHALVRWGEETLFDDRAKRAPFMRSRGLRW